MKMSAEKAFLVKKISEIPIEVFLNKTEKGMKSLITKTLTKEFVKKYIHYIGFTREKVFEFEFVERGETNGYTIDTRHLEWYFKGKI